MSSFDHYQATFYLQMILAPQAFTSRIAESLVPATRSYEVKTTYSLIVPREMSGKVLVLPVMLVRKGHLLDRFGIYDEQGHRRSTLSQDQTIVHTATTIRRLMALSVVPPEVISEYIARLEPKIVTFLARPLAVPADDGDFNDILQALWGLESRGLPPQIAGITQNLIEIMTAHYPVVIVQPSHGMAEESAHIEGCARVRLRVERREIPVQNSRQSASDKAIGFMRELIGVTPARILWPLQNSLLARSYHLETLGPPKTYLARQAIVNASGAVQHTGSTQQHILHRRGQRYGHLYIHARKETPPRVLTYMAVFYERPPGRTAAAMMSSFASLALLTVAAVSRLGNELDIPSDLVAVLLAVPAIASVWAGFDAQSVTYGGSLSARISQLATVALSLLGAAWYVAGTHPAGQQFHDPWISRPGALAWSLIISASIYSFVLIFFSWMLRAHIYRHFLNNSPEEGA